MALSPTQRTLRALEQQGCICGIVERFNPYAGPHGVRIDLFGFIDIIALYPTRICGIQSCGSSFSAHMIKIKGNEIAPEWIKIADIELWGWRKIKKKRGGRQMIWKPRVHKYTMEDFE